MGTMLGSATRQYRSAPLRRWDWFADRSLIVTDVALACCALEFESAAAEAVAAAEDVDHLPHAVVVSGTITDTLAPAVVAVVEQLRARVKTVHVVSFGACTATGGPYWDSPVVTKGLDQLVDVDRFVAGCPPPPGALHAALAELRDDAPVAQDGGTPVEPDARVTPGEPDARGWVPPVEPDAERPSRNHPDHRAQQDGPTC